MSAGVGYRVLMIEGAYLPAIVILAAAVKVGKDQDTRIVTRHIRQVVNAISRVALMMRTSATRTIY